MSIVENVNISKTKAVIAPNVFKKDYPLSEEAKDFVFKSRKEVEDILSGKDSRQFIVVGPCSIHDYAMAIEYAKKLKILSEEVKNEFLIIMRVYFEKPRTTVGWKGLINDPHLDGTFEMEEGLTLARKIMLDITDMGIPIGTEALDPISPQYLSDLITWSAIGARTTESQTHREMASGLSAPVGFKNATDGDIEVAINAMMSAANPHSFLGINEKGNVAIVTTKGNKYGHIILRGGSNGPNHDSVSIAEVIDQMEKFKVNVNIVVDCSHGNSHKNHMLQPIVFKDVISQFVSGTKQIKGVMLESNLFEGNQKFTYGKKEDLKFGVSITDACIGWEDTAQIVQHMATLIKK